MTVRLRQTCGATFLAPLVFRFSPSTFYLLPSAFFPRRSPDLLARPGHPPAGIENPPPAPQPPPAQGRFDRRPPPRAQPDSPLPRRRGVPENRRPSARNPARLAVLPAAAHGPFLHRRRRPQAALSRARFRPRTPRRRRPAARRGGRAYPDLARPQARPPGTLAAHPLAHRPRGGRTARGRRRAAVDRPVFPRARTCFRTGFAVPVGGNLLQAPSSRVLHRADARTANRLVGVGAPRSATSPII